MITSPTAMAPTAMAPTAMAPTAMAPLAMAPFAVPSWLDGALPVSSAPALVALLLAILAVLFRANETKLGQKLFSIVPLLVFAYFVPALFSNLGLMPMKSPAYDFCEGWLLPCSLFLLILSVDVVGIVKLGRPAVLLFLAATAGVVIGGPLAYLLLRGFVPTSLGEDAWKVLAAIGGSWIGGGANFIAIGKSVGLSKNVLGLAIVVDVAVANVWMAILLAMAGREEQMDARIGANRRALDAVREKAAAFAASIARPTTLTDLLTLGALAFCATSIAHWLSARLPTTEIISGFTWVVLIVTGASVAASFTPLRKLEGAGASKLGSAFLYLLIATIGAHAEFRRVLDAPALVAIGFIWISVHAATVMLVRRLLRAPIFFAAVGSQANVGGAASAPVVAAAFHPALPPVGVLLAVGGYVVGTPAGLLCAKLLKFVHHL